MLTDTTTEASEKLVKMNFAIFTALPSGTVPTVTPHDLRHTAASLAISAGANVKAVQRMLVHASTATTLDVYADLFNDDLESVAVAMSVARQAAVS